MFEKILECPVCNGSKFKNQIICQDFLVSGESFVLTDCESCGLRLTNPRPNQESIGRYYESDHYDPHSGKTSNIFNLIYKTVRSINLTWKKNLINQYSPHGRLLDFGTGTGEFVLKMKSNAWEVEGTELHGRPREFGNQKYNLDIKENLSQLTHNQVFTAITLWHVLEHIYDINSLLQQLASLLSKDGKLIIATPNILSYDAVKYGQDWAGYDVPRHLNHFKPKTMKKLLKRNGLTLQNIIPLKMDAYYVSILSEKNLKHSLPFLKGMIAGFRSNSWAAKNSDNYSSLVYIVRK
jgi:2-polyprenyl-3-methyl-5-hydroxy-6-metoxy-1,4-benzoquinol methylase